MLLWLVVSVSFEALRERRDRGDVGLVLTV
jgi:hypothetical protein